MPPKKAQDAATKPARKAPPKKPAAPKGSTKPATTGRPTSYKPEYAAQAKKLTMLGATDPELADFFEVAVSTVSRWKIMHPEFSEALKLGKDQADERVVSSLYHRATGYSHPDTDIRVIEGQIVKTELVKHYPPDTTAAIFWLKNRQKEDWRDRQDVNHGIQEDNPITALLQQVSGHTLKPDGDQ